GDRVRMLVDPETEIGKSFGLVDEQCRRLPSALVAAVALAGLENDDQPVGKRERLGSGEGLGHRRNGCFADQHVSLNSIVRPGEMAAPRCAVLAAPGCTCAF